jgi:hypothetical protein
MTIGKYRLAYQVSFAPVGVMNEFSHLGRHYRDSWVVWIRRATEMAITR